MGRTNKGTNYPWSRWLTPGAVTTLRRGRDYESTDRTMTAYIYRVARRYRQKNKASKVHVSVSQPKEGVIKITAHDGKLDGRRKGA